MFSGPPLLICGNCSAYVAFAPSRKCGLLSFVKQTFSEIPGTPTPKKQEQVLQILGNLALQGAKDPEIIVAARKIVMPVPARDDIGELRAIYDAVKTGVNNVRGLERGIRYTSDARSWDQFTTPQRLLDLCKQGACAEDCLPNETLVQKAVLSAEGAILSSFAVAISSLKVGDVIMGEGRWVEVTHTWDKGVQALLKFDLSNGTALRCTGGHQLFLADGTQLRARDVVVGAELLGYHGPNAHCEQVSHITVLKIESAGEAPTTDIEVEGSRFWLPETDTIVHNCDGHAIFVAALCTVVGFQAGVRMLQPPGEQWFTHVYAVARLPKLCPDGQHTSEVALDTTHPPGDVGWEGAGEHRTVWLP